MGGNNSYWYISARGNWTEIRIGENMHRAIEFIKIKINLSILLRDLPYVIFLRVHGPKLTDFQFIITFFHYNNCPSTQIHSSKQVRFSSRTYESEEVSLTNVKKFGTKFVIDRQTAMFIDMLSHVKMGIVVGLLVV